MNGPDDEFEVELEEEAAPVAETPTEETEVEVTPEAAKMAALEARVSELAGKSGSNPDTAALVEMGKQFLAAQAAANAPRHDPNASQADLASFGAAFQQAILLGKPEEAGAMFAQAVQAISQRDVNAALAKHGTPLAEKAGDYAVSTYLTARRDAAGENGGKLHNAVTKALDLQPNERAWIAQASGADAKRYLDQKYEQAAGRVLLASSSRAKPRDISGSGGAAGGGSNVTQFPGVDARSQRALERLAETYWPDPKVRAAKMKGFIESMKEAN